MEFNTFEDHKCKGAFNAETWMFDGELTLIFKDDQMADRHTWVNYCPYCGFKAPKQKTPMLLKGVPQDYKKDYHTLNLKIDGTSPVRNAYFVLSEKNNEKA